METIALPQLQKQLKVFRIMLHAESSNKCKLHYTIIPAVKCGMLRASYGKQELKLKKSSVHDLHCHKKMIQTTQTERLKNAIFGVNSLT